LTLPFASWHGPAAAVAGVVFDTTPETSAAVTHAAARTATSTARLTFFIVPPSSF
jgi:hypothetical protein